MKPEDLEILKLIGAACAPVLTIGATAWGIIYQMRKNAEQERIARSMEMRRQVYFEAIEAFAAYQFSLMEMASLEKPIDTTKMEKFLGPTARINLIADIETLEVVSDYFQKVFKAQGVIATKRFGLSMLKTDSER